MGFKFSSLVELLEDLERNRYRKASNASRSVNPDHGIIVQWFNRHDAKIKRNRGEGVAFLSCLFPERRPDRCFHMQETRLTSVFGKVYQLGTSRLKELRAWKECKPADFPNCLASILAQTEMPGPRPGNEVTLEEIDYALDQIAANVKSSAPTLRANATFSDAVDILTPILYRLRSVEAKWLVRMLLKSYHPAQIPELMTMQQFHFLLPDLLNIQNDLGAAVDTLNQAEIGQLPNRVSKADAVVLRARLAGHLIPKIGVMIKRQAYHKARSIKHCCQMVGGKVMSVEQKYDGEYCQVHIDMSKIPSERIQIFSKSGRDSTQDRLRLHHAIEVSLNLKSGSRQCAIKDRCILEGELLIYSRNTGTIQPFHKIRNHVQHGGRYHDHEADSPFGLDEQVMIMYYDILLLDHTILLERPQEERRRRLEHLITSRKGLSEIGIQHTINFGSRKASEHLRKVFAKCITQRLEGLVLKFCKDPYFSCTSSIYGIKLKKDYVTQMSDIADVAFLGARLDPKARRNLGHGDLRWNSFYMGCLENKQAVIRFDAKPVFRVLGEVSFIPEHDMEYLNMRGEILAVPFLDSTDYMNISIDTKQMKTPEVLFKTPFVVEILGSGYERVPNATYWTLRHPRLHKIHGDRSVLDTVSFDELQNMAKTAQTTPVDATSEEDREWIEKLERADPKSKYILDKSPSTATTPGKSPDSVTIASLTLVRTVSKSLPFAIWSDASQSPEVTNRVLSQESRSPIKSKTSNVIKRRCDDEADVLRHKKLRLASPGRSEILLLDSSPLTRPRTFTPVDEARAVGRPSISKTPPWCRPDSSAGPSTSSPFAPPAVFRSSASERRKRSSSTRRDINMCKADREPLRKVEDSSTAHNAIPASRLPQYTDKNKEQEQSAKVGNRPQPETSTLARPRTTPLPTPPSSAEKTRNRQQPKQSEVKHLSTTNEPPSKRSPETPSLSDQRPECQTVEQTPHMPMLPPPPLLLTSSSADAMKTILPHLWSTDISFTTSSAHFLAHVPFHAVTIILLDITASSTKTAHTIRDIMDGLLALTFRATGRQRGHVLFMDWRFLEAMKDGKDQWEALASSSSRGCFAGCLKWDVDRCGENENVETKRSAMVRECFDWKEAIRFDD